MTDSKTRVRSMCPVSFTNIALINSQVKISKFKEKKTSTHATLRIIANNSRQTWIWFTTLHPLVNRTVNNTSMGFSFFKILCQNNVKMYCHFIIRQTIKKIAQLPAVSIYEMGTVQRQWENLQKHIANAYGHMTHSNMDLQNPLLT